MNINRHNYEEFFLLYVDNELSAADRKAVDVFVKQNPDLQIELSLLEDTVAKADDIVLDKKDWLFMDEGVSALQENLLLYADGELLPADKKAVEALLATDKAARTEWNILRQTQLEADTTIVFADKQSLYRKEGGKVVGFNWQRIAAAAILLGFMLWAGVTIYKNNFKKPTAEDGIATTDKTKPGQINNETPATKNTATPVTTTPTEIIAQQNTAPNSNTASIEKNAAEKKSVTAKQPAENIAKQNVPEQKEVLAVENNNPKPSNNLPKSYLENINKEGSNPIASSNVTPKSNNTITGSGIKIDIVDTDLTKTKTTDATTVAFTGDEKSDDRFLYMDEEKAKRTKLGGLLRKAKRLVERTTNIKTGDGLKVAGFEIALK